MKIPDIAEIKKFIKGIVPGVRVTETKWSGSPFFDGPAHEIRMSSKGGIVCHLEVKINGATTVRIQNNGAVIYQAVESKPEAWSWIKRFAEMARDEAKIKEGAGGLPTADTPFDKLLEQYSVIKKFGDASSTRIKARILYLISKKLRESGLDELINSYHMFRMSDDLGSQLPYFIFRVTDLIDENPELIFKLVGHPGLPTNSDRMSLFPKLLPTLDDSTLDTIRELFADLPEAKWIEYFSNIFVFDHKTKPQGKPILDDKLASMSKDRVIPFMAKLGTTIPKEYRKADIDGDDDGLINKLEKLAK